MLVPAKNSHLRVSEANLLIANLNTLGKPHTVIPMVVYLGRITEVPTASLEYRSANS